MKQHITIEQLNELSDKGKEKLEAFSQKLYKQDTTLPLISKKDQFNSVHNYILLSIGQMIEFLVGQSNYTVNLDSMGYAEVLERKNCKFYKEETCDALWEAVKEVLRNKL